MGITHFLGSLYPFLVTDPFGTPMEGWRYSPEKCTWTHTVKTMFTTSGPFLQYTYPKVIYSTLLNLTELSKGMEKETKSFQR